MAPAAPIFRLSKSCIQALTEKFWIILLIGIGGAVAGYFQAEKIPLFSARAIIELGYHHTPQGFARASTAKDVASQIQADIDKLAEHNIYGKSFLKHVEAVSSERRFLMITLRGNDPLALQSSLSKISGEHVALLKKRDAQLLKEAGQKSSGKKKAKRTSKKAPEKKIKRHFLETYEIPYPFSNVISNKASRIVLPALYAAFGASFAFIGLLLLNRRKTAPKA